jgi:hypothetical protein
LGIKGKGVGKLQPLSSPIKEPGKMKRKNTGDEDDDDMTLPSKDNKKKDPLSYNPALKDDLMDEHPSPKKKK